MSSRTRQQTRALHAYERVAKVLPKERADYATQVHTLGSAVLRNGLAAALAFLERDAKPPSQLLVDLADAGLPGVGPGTGTKLPETVRRLGTAEYMLVTRELLQVLVWFRRAVQATFTEEERSHVADGKR